MRVLFFAQLKDVTGCSECSLAPNGTLTADDLWAELTAKFPGLQVHRPVVRLTRNWEYAGPETRFIDADEVALVTPVSGG